MLFRSSSFHVNWPGDMTFIRQDSKHHISLKSSKIPSLKTGKLPTTYAIDVGFQRSQNFQQYSSVMLAHCMISIQKSKFIKAANMLQYILLLSALTILGSQSSPARFQSQSVQPSSSLLSAVEFLAAPQSSSIQPPVVAPVGCYFGCDCPRGHIWSVLRQECVSTIIQDYYYDEFYGDDNTTTTQLTTTINF